VEDRVRITSKGQVTIPQDIREAAGFLPNTEVDFVVDGDLVFLVKATGPHPRPTRGGRAVAALHSADADFDAMSTDSLMALLRGEP
jgi:AbrB family looped-hinge helix DNA binding protein